MKALKVLVPALLLLTLAMSPATSVVAQTDSAADMANLLESLETVHGREASFDFSGTTTVDPNAMWMIAGAYVFDFHDETSAAAAIDILGEQGPLASMSVQMDDAVIEEMSLDLDVDHHGLRIVSEDDGVLWTTMQVTVQDGDLLYMVFGLAGGIDPTGKTETLLTGMIEAEISDEPEQFNADGTSTGGMWEKVSPVEAIQADAGELSKIQDVYVLVKEAGTPAA